MFHDNIKIVELERKATMKNTFKIFATISLWEKDGFAYTTIIENRLISREDANLIKSTGKLMEFEISDDMVDEIEVGNDFLINLEIYDSESMCVYKNEYWVGDQEVEQYTLQVSIKNKSGQILEQKEETLDKDDIDDVIVNLEPLYIFSCKPKKYFWWSDSEEYIVDVKIKNSNHVVVYRAIDLLVDLL